MISLARRFAVVVAFGSMLWASASVEATIGPPVKVRWARPLEMAEDGVPYNGRIEVLAGASGELEVLRLEGVGWSIERFVAPVSVMLAREETLVLEFTATGDPARPIILSFTFEGRPVRRSLYVPTEPRVSAQGGGRLLQSAARSSRSTASTGESLPSPEPAPPGTREARAERTFGDGGGGGGSRRIQVRGRVVYPHGRGEVSAVDGATVRVKDSDVGPDDTLKTGRTDSGGYFVVSFHWNPEYWGLGAGDDPDIFVEIEAKNGAVTVQSSGLELNYKWRTDQTWNNYTGSDLDVGTLEPEENYIALHILTTVTRAWRWIYVNGDHSLPSVDVQWPDGEDGAWYNSVFGEMHVSSAREHSEGTIVHEYGHHFIHTFGNQEGSAPNYCNGFCDEEREWWFDDCGHCLWCRESWKVAWSEGWPDWLADVVCRDLVDRYGLTLFESRVVETVERCHEDDEYHEPYATEGFLAALLRDIEDDATDRNPGYTTGSGFRDCLRLGALPIFNVTVKDQPRSALQFLERFAERYPQYHEQLYATARNNGFDFSAPEPPTVRSVLDSFSAPDGVPPGWTVWSGNWSIRSGALRVSTGSLQDYRGFNPSSAILSRQDGRLDVFLGTLAREVVQLQGGRDSGWSGRNISQDLPAGTLLTEAPEWAWFDETSGSTHVLARSKDRTTWGRRLVHFRHSAASGWAATDVTGLPGIGDAFGVNAPLAAWGSNGQIGVLSTGRFGSLLAFSWTSGGGWTAEDVSAILDGDRKGTFTFTNSSLQYDPVSLVRLADGALHVFGPGTARIGGSSRQGILHLIYEPTSSWDGELLESAPGFSGLPAPLQTHHRVVARGPRVEFLGKMGTSSVGSVVRSTWSRGAGWSAWEDATALSRWGDPVSVFEAASVSPDRLDVIAVAGAASTPLQLAHLSWTEDGGWSSDRAWGERREESARQVDGLHILPGSVDTKLEVVFSAGGLTPPYYLWNVSWRSDTGWESQDLTGHLQDLGTPFSQTVLAIEALEALRPRQGEYHLFGARYGSLDGSYHSNLLHVSRKTGEGWVAEDVHEGDGGQSAWIYAGAPEMSFAGVDSVSFRLRFLTTPDDEIGRRAGMLALALGHTPLETGNSGYRIYWSDPAGTRGYHIDRIQGGIVTDGKVASSFEPGEVWTVRLEDDRLVLTVDGEQKIDWATTIARTGFVGLFAEENGQRVEFDDVRILTSPPPPPPTPSAPTGLVLFERSDSILLDWADNLEADLAGYHLERRSPGQAQFARLTSAPRSESSYIDRDVSPGLRFAYRVLAVNTSSRESAPSATVAGEVTGGQEASFRRGDANGDGAVDLSDSVFTLNNLFLGGPSPGCSDSADSNDDGAVDISDAIYVLGFLFLGGAPPGTPFQGCGSDPTPDGLRCGSFPSC